MREKLKSNGEFWLQLRSWRNLVGKLLWWRIIMRWCSGSIVFWIESSWKPFVILNSWIRDHRISLNVYTNSCFRNFSFFLVYWVFNLLFVRHLKNLRVKTFRYLYRSEKSNGVVPVRLQMCWKLRNTKVLWLMKTRLLVQCKSARETALAKWTWVSEALKMMNWNCLRRTKK